jgi:hypothetical protein
VTTAQERYARLGRVALLRAPSRGLPCMLRYLCEEQYTFFIVPVANQLRIMNHVPTVLKKFSACALEVYVMTILCLSLFVE